MTASGTGVKSRAERGSRISPMSFALVKERTQLCQKCSRATWTKPAAMAIPKGGYLGKPEQGDTARSFRRLRPATASPSSQS